MATQIRTLEDLALPYLDYESHEYRADPASVVRAARERIWLARSVRGYEVLSYETCSQLTLDKPRRSRQRVLPPAERFGPDHPVRVGRHAPADAVDSPRSDPARTTTGVLGVTSEATPSGHARLRRGAAGRSHRQR